jgi:peptidoglycan/xylan/chitin deacetylase (PgdA/CDA1 family)
MKHALATFLYVCAHFLGVNLLLKWLNRHKIRVLMYHGVTSTPLPTSYTTQVSRVDFAWQMRYVSRHYHCCGSEVLTSQSRGTDDNRVVITFDDGLENVYTEAWPVLKRYGVPATVFVLPQLSIDRDCIWTDKVYDLLVNTSAGSLDLERFNLGRHQIQGCSTVQRARLALSLNRKLKWMPVVDRRSAVAEICSQLAGPEHSIHPAFRLMTPEQITHMAASSEIEIGAHTQTHQILSTLPPDQQRSEIEGCLQQLREWGGKVPGVFAYPNGNRGDFTDHTIEILRDNSIACAVTTIRGHHLPGSDPYRVRRVVIGDDTSRWEFRAKLSGFFYVLAWFEDVFLGGDANKQPRVQR